jgi:hypothetical protein
MFFTIDGADGSTSFEDCFDHLRRDLKDHYLLTVDERERCMKALDELMAVMSRFKK